MNIKVKKDASVEDKEKKNGSSMNYKIEDNNDKDCSSVDKKSISVPLKKLKSPKK